MKYTVLTLLLSSFTAQAFAMDMMQDKHKMMMKQEHKMMQDGMMKDSKCDKMMRDKKMGMKMDMMNDQVSALTSHDEGAH